jgi:hypothetical protein
VDRGLYFGGDTVMPADTGNSTFRARCRQWRETCPAFTGHLLANLNLSPMGQEVPVPTRVIPLTALVASLCVACAAPPADSPDSEAAAAGPRDLILLEGSGTDAVVSEIEAGRTVLAPARDETGVRTPASAVEPAHVHVVVEPPAPRLTAEVVPAGTGIAMPAMRLPRVAAADAAEAGGPADAGHGDATVAADDRPERGRGVIIRGGVRVEDDCAIHMPGRTAIPTQGVLINERGPRVGLPSFPRGGFR